MRDGGGLSGGPELQKCAWGEGVGDGTGASGCRQEHTSGLWGELAWLRPDPAADPAAAAPGGVQQGLGQGPCCSSWSCRPSQPHGAPQVLQPVLPVVQRPQLHHRHRRGAACLLPHRYAHPVGWGCPPSGGLEGINCCTWVARVWAWPGMTWHPCRVGGGSGLALLRWG